MTQPVAQAAGDRVHVAGVAGVGMSALAQALRDAGCAVSGSDRFADQGQDLEVLQRLKAAGIRLTPQDGSALDAGTKFLAVSTAIEPDNPERTAAARLGVPVVHRAAALAALARGKRCVAITGTAGKTTVTALVGWILEQAGWDPTVVNGGVLLDWRAPNRVGNVRTGRSDWWVIEADESDRSLVQFDPEWAVVTYVSKDHFELAEVRRLFEAFARKAHAGVIAGPGVTGLPGQRPAAGAFSPRRRAGGWAFALDGVELAAPMPGRHNAENAFVAVSVCRTLGVAPARIAEALASFRGVHRRLERVGTRGGVTVIDDYAHNPAKIEASWTAVAETARQVIGFWRPHGFAPLALMKGELADAFARACRPDDRLFILPVFYAGGTATASFTAEDFVHMLAGRGVPAGHVAGFAELRRALVGAAASGDTILGMGARDPELPRFAVALAQDGDLGSAKARGPRAESDDG
jgi:UDP-N-acetylmuramate--alanine ligase